MTDIVKIDPFLYGYFLDETLEHGERVGLALLYASKNIEIKFSRRLLPKRAKAPTSFRTHPHRGVCAKRSRRFWLFSIFLQFL